MDKSLIDLYKKGHDDPVFFVENVIGLTTLWEKQKEIAHSVRDNKFTCVRSCNGAGKTFTTANVVTHFLVTNPNSIVITTAPTSRQVRELLWQEIRNIQSNAKYPLGGTTTLVSWTLGAKWFALGLSTDEPNRFQGFHAEHILGVIDEAAGVDPPIWEGMDAILTSSGARLLVIGNPTEPSGRFYDAFSSPLYHKIHISAFDTPNFTHNDIQLEDIKSGVWRDKFKSLLYPALITPQWVSERLQEWGEDSPAFQSRIMGNFPIIGSDTMIPLSWVLRATEREVDEKDTSAPIMAIDVARFGDDDSSIAIRHGSNLIKREDFHALDVNPLSKVAKHMADADGDYTIATGDGVIIVDAVGIGAGVASNLRAWGYRAIDFVAQGRAWEQDKFVNRRTEAWFRTREKFRTNQINLVHDEKLIGQLTSPKYDFDGAGRYRLESKEHMKDRGLKSPDCADAVVMAFDFDGELETSIASDFVGATLPKKDTVEDLLKMVTKGREETVEWDIARF